MAIFSKNYKKCHSNGDSLLRTIQFFARIDDQNNNPLLKQRHEKHFQVLRRAKAEESGRSRRYSQPITEGWSKCHSWLANRNIQDDGGTG